MAVDYSKDPERKSKPIDITETSEIRNPADLTKNAEPTGELLVPERLSESSQPRKPVRYVRMGNVDIPPRSPAGPSRSSGPSSGVATAASWSFFAGFGLLALVNFTSGSHPDAPEVPETSTSCGVPLDTRGATSYEMGLPYVGEPVMFRGDQVGPQEVEFPERQLPDGTKVSVEVVAGDLEKINFDSWGPVVGNGFAAKVEVARERLDINGSLAVAAPGVGQPVIVDASTKQELTSARPGFVCGAPDEWKRNRHEVEVETDASADCASGDYIVAAEIEGAGPNRLPLAGFHLDDMCRITPIDPDFATFSF